METNNTPEVEASLDTLNIQELTSKIDEGGDDSKEAYERVVGAMGQDFLSAMSVIQQSYTKKQLNSICLHFDASDGDVYEIIIGRNLKERLGIDTQELLKVDHPKGFEDKEIRDDN